MDRINQMVEVVRQSHHLPWVLAFIVGLIIARKSRIDDVEILGDNIPTTLIEGLGR